MKKEPNKTAALRKLRWQLALPGPMVLLMTLLFWSLGGGAGPEPAAAEIKPGLNVQVPPAAADGKPVDKLSLYKVEQMDSIKKAQRDRGATRLLGEDSVSAFDTTRFGRRPDPHIGRNGSIAADANEIRLRQQLADLQRTLNASPISPRPAYRIPEPATYSPAPTHSMDISRMERLIASLKESGSAGSPEMKELNRTLDKLIAVKTGRTPNPQTTSQIDTAAHTILSVEPLGKEEAVSSMKTGEAAHNRFYDLESSTGDEEPTVTAMEAIVPSTQTLVTGATIRLELASELMIRGQRIGKGASLYGIARLTNDRLQVSISSIRSGTDVYPVALRVLDQDGLAGIYAPGSITRDAARESASEAVGSLGPTGLETTTSGQAMNAGIQLARNLARRKVQLARVTVKAGYRVFLQDETKGH